MSSRLSLLLKLIQKRLYTFLSYKYSIWLCFLLCICIIYFSFYLLDPVIYRFSEVDQNDDFIRKLDIVYTYVNGSDPRHIFDRYRYGFETLDKDKMEAYTNCLSSNETTNCENLLPEFLMKNRFKDHDELRYSLRSLSMYFAPFISNIYIVTNGQIPSWLNMENEKIKIITHDEIYKNLSHLPTFSSPSIESSIHRIPNLSPFFLYLNDDVMFGNYIYPSDFYTSALGYIIYLMWDIPSCAEGCPEAWLHDGYCDKVCNTTECNYDGGDCINMNITSSYLSYGSTFYSHSGSLCHEGCPNSWIGDRMCDRNCNVEECGFDGGDCGFDSYTPFMIYSNDSITVYSSDNYLVLSYSGIDDEAAVTSAFNDNPSILRFTSVFTFNKMILIVFSGFGTINFKLISSLSLNDTLYQNEFLFSVIRLAPSDNNKDNETLLESASSQLIPNATSRKLLAIKDPIELNIQSIHNILNDFNPNSVFIDSLPDDIENMILQNKVGNTVVVNSRPLLQFPTHQFNEKYLYYHDYITNSKKKQMLLYSLSLLQIPLSEHEIIIRNKYSISPLTPPLSLSELKTIIDSYPHLYSLSSASRHLMDAYGESLRFVNTLFTTRFGKETRRRAIAHMPFLVNKYVEEELQNMFPEYFEETSSHKFRQSNDMQYAYSYYYFIMLNSYPHKLDVYFSHWDLDNDGYLSFAEWRRASLILCRGNEADALVLTNSILSDLSMKVFSPLSSSLLNRSESFLNIFTNHNMNRFKYHIGENMDDIRFYMYYDNATLIRDDLNNIIATMPKFICLNDNTPNNMTSEEYEAINNELITFYETIYPHPSPYELPIGKINRFQHMNEYMAYLSLEKKKKSLFLLSIIFLLIIFMILYKFRDRIFLIKKGFFKPKDNYSHII